jgi:hypothetical protein
MKRLVLCGTVFLSLAVVSPADAKGCLKGAAVGGAAGHFAGHHGLLGAAAGCMIGRHNANKAERNGQNNQDGEYNNRQTTNGQDVGYRR